MSNPLDRRAGLHAIVFRALLAATALSCGNVALAERPSRSQFAIKRGEMPTPVRSMTLRDAEDRPIGISAIAMNPQTGDVVIAGADEAIRLVNPRSMRITKMIGTHRDRIRTLSFDSEGRKLVSAGNDGQLIIWDASKNYRLQQRMSGTPALARVCFAPTSHELAAVGFDNEVFLIGGSKQSSKRPRKFTCECRDLRAVAYRDDGQLIAVAGRSGDLHLFDADSGKLLVDKGIHRGRINDAVFARQSNLLVTVGDDGYVCVFDTGRRQTIKREKISTGKLFSVAVLSSQWVAVAGSDNDIRIVNIDEVSIVRTLKGHRGSIPALASGNGYLFSGGFDATLRRWSIDKLQPDEQRIAEGASNEKK